MNERVRLNEETLQDLINIQTGLFDPLDGFMREEDFHSAVERYTLEDGQVFPMPITLDVPEAVYRRLTEGDVIDLTLDGKSVAQIKAESKFQVSEEDIRKIFCTSGETISSNHLKCSGIAEICIVVKRHKFVWKTVIEKFRIVYTTVSDKPAHTKIIVLHKHVYVRYAGTARLTADVRHAVAGSGRHCHHLSEATLVLHERIKHTTGKHSPHASSLEHKPCIPVYLHYFSLKIVQRYLFSIKIIYLCKIL